MLPLATTNWLPLAISNRPPALFVRVNVKVSLRSGSTAVSAPTTVRLTAPSVTVAALSAMLVGSSFVSILKALEDVVPTPALPATSFTPGLFRVITASGLKTPSRGVNVPVHVTPPSDEMTGVSVPFATVRSPFAKPVTGSLNVMTTCELWPSDS